MSAIPPAPLERETFSVLESRNDAIDLALWQVLRDVLLWARTQPDHRVRLFRAPSAVVRARMQEAADEAPLLADPLAVLARLRILPGQVAPERIAVACEQVHEWADRSGLHAVAVHFAEASAYVEPLRPSWAVHAAYMTRMAGGGEMLARCEQWLARAYVIAVQQRDLETVVRALTGAGALMKDQGEYGKARHLYRQAARRALNDGTKRRAAVALHYAFALAAETGHVRAAVRDANAALRNYPLHDERIPALVHDFAYLLVRNRHYGTALRLVEGLGERVEGMWTMGMLYGITARAAAGAGMERSWGEAAEAALSIARINDECAGPVFINLAEAGALPGALGGGGRVRRTGARDREEARRHGSRATG